MNPLGWHATLAPLLAEVDRARPDLKALKEWLRLRSLFDRDTFETLMDLLDIRLGATVTLGPAARALLDADDEAAARAALADRLIRENPLLAKYCLEALDVDKGGRLHSTNELYRMVTSYVYPGAKPTLNAFKAWVDWAVGAGLLKLVGIRWALGEAGRERLPRMRALDAEEFLEEEREAAKAAALEAQPEAREEAGLRAPDEGSKPVEDMRGAAATPAPTGDRGAVRSPARAVPGGLAEPTGPPVAAPAPTHPSVALDLAATRDALAAWYAGWQDREASRWPDVPLSAGSAGVFEAAALALWIARGMRPDDATRVLAFLRGSGTLSEAGAGTLTLAALSAATAGSSDPAVATALETAAVLPRLHSGAGDPGLLDAANPRALLDRLWRGLYAPATPLAPFLLARILRGAGRLPGPLAAAALVPTFAVRQNAFRIGFLDRLHAASFDDLVDSALSLSVSFGPPDLEGPLAHVHEVFGCAFWCGRVTVCPLTCRERTEVAPGPRP